MNPTFIEYNVCLRRPTGLLLQIQKSRERLANAAGFYPKGTRNPRYKCIIRIMSILLDMDCGGIIVIHTALLKRAIGNYNVVM
jgi:hypothetical protein